MKELFFEKQKLKFLKKNEKLKFQKLLKKCFEKLKNKKLKKYQK